MVEKTATIRNEQGIHCRPSTVIVKVAKEHYENEITVTSRKGKTDLRSVIGLVGLELLPGVKVKIRVSGPDEETLCRKFVDLFETRFDFPPREDEPAAEQAAKAE